MQHKIVIMFLFWYMFKVLLHCLTLDIGSYLMLKLNLKSFKQFGKTLIQIMKSFGLFKNLSFVLFFYFMNAAVSL